MRPPENNNSQVRRVPHGKILRVTRRGRPVANNPFAQDRGARTLHPALLDPGRHRSVRRDLRDGLRNPFRFARMPGTSTFYVNDVGLNTWEEVNRLRKGRNYGWNVREGFCRRGLRHQLRSHPVSPTRSTPTGTATTAGRSLAARSSPTGSGPDSTTPTSTPTSPAVGIFRLDRRSDGTFRRAEILRGPGGPTHLRFGPFGDRTALYYLSFFGNEVHRVTTARDNTPPVADLRSPPTAAR